MKKLRCSLLLTAVLAAALGAVVAADKEHVLFTEPFDGKLADGWFWVREDPKAWKIDKGSLVVRTSMGSLWQNQNNNRNLLLRKPPAAKNSRLLIEVRVENEPSNGFEHAGLVWYYDDDNYAILVKEKVGAGPIIQLVSETQGRPKVGFAQKPYKGKTVWLRMEVSGGRIRGQYRATEKDTWQTLGQCDLPGKGEAQFGLLTGYAPKNVEHFARFSKFRILREVK